jgi:hypothetical protein
MSVKNCSRDVLVSRYSSQMALDEYISTNACENIDIFFLGIIFIASSFTFNNINDI